MHTINTDVYMMCEVPATMNVVNVTCLMLTDFFQTILPAVFLMSVSQNENKIKQLLDIK